MATLREIVDYYVDLLALQYKRLPRARANISIYVKQVVADMLVQQLATAYDVDTAVGHQLDIVGKYVGVPRNIGVPISRPYFGFVSYNSGDPQNLNGMRAYLDPTINASGIFYDYLFLGSQNTDLSDISYALILKLKIILNANDGTLASIQDYLHTFLPGVVTVVDNADMTLTYRLVQNTPVDPTVLEAYLPKPMGVGVNFIFLTATASPATRSGTFLGLNPSGHTVGTGSSTCAVTNGVGLITYNWQRVSGDSINADTPHAAVTTFSYFFDAGIGNATRVAVFQCTVTDGNGISAISNTVTVTITIGPPP